MKRKILNSLMFGCLIILTTTLNSCQKEGCIDPDSTTYDSTADKDDGTCQYEGEIVLWYDLEASNGLINDGSSSLTFYVDGQVVGSTACLSF